ncbi:DnaJ domain-containing protein [Acaryochloris sp. IP29b_bin.148]|uniref:J domain-containing protein n=1 Tax=Acaryochloris sp. IP29b_bin.148 TaxID=2969218 RepID=UPI0026187FF5|nr:DnaJ domain-containing protein [Acaryochloris sp. IP29b_bin.148]
MADLQPYLQLLQVSKDVTLAELKAAFRRHARECHPDLHPDNPNAEAEFQQLSEAYEIVSETLYPSTPIDEFRHADHSQRVTTAQALYARATQKVTDRDYEGALADYTAAIDQDPEFLDAYLKRCQVRFVQGDDSGVLADCRTILKLDDTVAQAYYYQGRARFQLGAVPSAIAAYSQAIALDEYHAKAWFHRGRARLDLQETKLARKDLQQAESLFQAEGKSTEVHRVQVILQDLDHHPRRPLKVKSPSRRPFRRENNFLKDIFITIPQFFWNPSGGLLPTFARLSPNRARIVGIGYAAIATLCFVLAANLYPLVFVSITLLERIILGIVPFLSLVGLNQLARNITRTRGSWTSDIFISGATLLPLGLLMFVSGLVAQLGPWGIVLSATYLGCDAVLILYFGCSQINNLSEQSATLAVPTQFLASGGLTYWTYTLLAS